jgi:hypothetical protein
MVIALIALFVSLGGTAAALSGSNTVFSDDITDNEVRTADVRNDTLAGGGLGAADLKPSAVGQSELAAGAVTNPKLGANAVTSPKVLDNALTGTDVDEGTLFNDNSLNGADLAHNLTLGVTSTETLDLNSDGSISPRARVTATSWTDSPINGGVPNTMAQLDASGGVSAWDCPGGLCTKSGAVDLSGVFGQRLELATIPVPSAPSAGRAFLYITDTGDGRQRLQVKFADGDVDELAIDAP